MVSTRSAPAAKRSSAQVTPKKSAPRTPVKKVATPSSTPVSTPTRGFKRPSDLEPLHLAPRAQLATPPRSNKKRRLERETTPTSPLSTTATVLDDVESIAPGRYEPEIVLQLLKRVAETLRGHAQPYLPYEGEAISREEVAALPALPTLETWEMDVRAQLDRTIREGEGNCLLLIGPRSVGKTALTQKIVERTLSLLADAHGKDGFVVVRLNGLVCTSDRATLREIARQLCTDAGAIDDDGSSFTTHATILSSLLSILEPKQQSGQTRPIVFILDEFDLFALRDARQSFLYCLLDIVQSKKRTSGGMTVLGLSARIDCVHQLEKRVKSRCQSRILHVQPPSTLEGFLSVGRAVMSVDPKDSPMARDWNVAVEAFMSSPAVKREIQAIYDLRASKADLLARLGTVVARLAADANLEQEAIGMPTLHPKTFALIKPSTTRASLDSITLVELAVLIAAKNLCRKAASVEKPTFNLAMCYDEYHQFARRSSSNQSVSHRSFGKLVFTRAFEHLYALEMIIDAIPSAAGRSSVAQVAPIWFRKCRLVPWLAHIDELVKTRPGVPQAIKQWLAHDVVV